MGSASENRSKRLHGTPSRHSYGGLDWGISVLFCVYYQYRNKSKIEIPLSWHASSSLRLSAWQSTQSCLHRLKLRIHVSKSLLLATSFPTGSFLWLNDIEKTGQSTYTLVPSAGGCHCSAGWRCYILKQGRGGVQIVIAPWRREKSDLEDIWLELWHQNLQTLFLASHLLFWQMRPDI